MGVAVFGLFVVWERRGTAEPMLPLRFFRRPNFTWANVETAAVYGGLALLFFVLVVFLQQTARYGALEAGAATIPTTVVMFLLAKRFGALADRHGPRLFMAAGPVVSASGVLYLLAKVDETPALVSDVLPGTTIFALGLAIVVAPLTATVLADVQERNVGIASGVNNAVARVAGLLATASVGTVAGGILDVGGFRMALVVVSGLLVLGGAVGIWGIRNPRRDAMASDCAGGQVAGSRAAIARASSGARPDVSSGRAAGVPRAAPSGS
jgi:predicted MFS family arabinose efflux permease